MQFLNVTILASTLALVNLSATADIIEGNVILSFHERESLANSIDKTISLNPTEASQRLVNERLGAWLGTSIQLNAEHRMTVAINDPGISPAPIEFRPLIRVDSNAQINGNLIGGNALSPYNSLSKIWGCQAGQTRCTLAGSQNYFFTAPQSAYGSATQALSGVHLNATAADFEILFPGVTPRLGAITPPPTVILNPTESFQEIQGTLNLRATYQSKSIEQYLGDALAASSSASSNWVNWLTAATSDVAQLRSATYQSFPTQAGTTPVSGVQELMQTNVVLAYARDAAKWQALGSSPGGNLNTNSRLVTQLWNLTALSELSLSRTPAGFDSSTPYLDAGLLDLASVQAGLNSGTAESFTERFLDKYSGSGQPSSSSSPAFTLNGNDYGLDGALIQVFFTEGSGDGQFEIGLPAAQKHSMWKPDAGIDNISLLEGQGFEIPGWGLLEQPGDSLYVGESGSLLSMLVNPALGGIRLRLNNFYSPNPIVVASWGVSQVPTPAAFWLFGSSLIGMGFFTRRNHARQ